MESRTNLVVDQDESFPSNDPLLSQFLRNQSIDIINESDKRRVRRWNTTAGFDILEKLFHNRVSTDDPDKIKFGHAQ